MTKRNIFKSGESVEGTVSVNRGGFGFVKVEGVQDSVFLPPPEVSGLLHGDRLRVRVKRERDGRWSGKVEAVLERAVKVFLGTLEQQGTELWVRSADQRLGLNCRVQGAASGAKKGDWVLAKLIEAARETRPASAEILRRLDPERPVELATETAIAKYELATEFSAEALRNANAWGTSVDAAESARRKDLRALPLVTIDGADARDFDDAVYAEHVKGGFRLVVAIADVSHYVRPGSVLDAEAIARGTSVYFPDRVLPMLPTALSNHLCSLEPAVDRLCMVADMEVSAQGGLESWQFYPAVMRSAARLTYDQADAALFKGIPAARDALGAVLPSLLPLVDVYRALLKARRRRGALDLDAAESEFILDSAGRVEGVEFPARNDAHKLIEECMVLANVAAARQLAETKVPALYRVHAPPDDRKLEVLTTTLRVLGMDPQLPASAEIQTRDLAAIAPAVKETEDRAFVESLIVRSMAQAMYQPGNIGHFGLALTHYAHFTSPIRRYPDLMVHRALRVSLGLEPPETLPQGDALAALGVELSRLEKRADESDRFVSSFLKCVWLRDRVGQSFDALITTVVEFGCFVRILAVGTDGLLHLSSLNDDDYQLSRDGGQWLGKRSKRKLAPGQRLRVTVMAVRPVEGLVDLVLADRAP